MFKQLEHRDQSVQFSHCFSTLSLSNIAVFWLSESLSVYLQFTLAHYGLCVYDVILTDPGDGEVLKIDL